METMKGSISFPDGNDMLSILLHARAISNTDLDILFVFKKHNGRVFLQDIHDYFSIPKTEKTLRNHIARINQIIFRYNLTIKRVGKNCYQLFHLRPVKFYD